jgi:hypothetical protein
LPAIPYDRQPVSEGPRQPVEVSELAPFHDYAVHRFTRISGSTPQTCRSGHGARVLLLISWRRGARLHPYAAEDWFDRTVQDPADGDDHR